METGDVSEEEVEEESSYCSDDTYEYEYVDEDAWPEEGEDFTMRSDRILAALKEEKPPGGNLKTTGLDDDDDDDDEQVDTTATTLLPTTTTDSPMLRCPKCLTEEHQPVQDCQRVATWTSKRNQLPTVDPVFIKACLERFIRLAATRLGIHRDAAEALCRRYRWDMDAIVASGDPLYERARDVHNFGHQHLNQSGGSSDDDDDDDEDSNNSDNDDVKQAVENRNSQRSNKRQKESSHDNITCPICFDDYAEVDTMALSTCQHAFCRTCWHSYLRTHLEEGRFIELICPAEGCTEAVLSRHIQQVAADLLPLLEDIQLRSFVEANEDTLQWCPGCILQNHPNSHVAVYPRHLFLEHGRYGFVCNACQSRFCFHCHDPPHDGPCKFRNRNQGVPENRPAVWHGSEWEEAERAAQGARPSESVRTAGEIRAEAMVQEAEQLGLFNEAAYDNDPLPPASYIAPAVNPAVSASVVQDNADEEEEEVRQTRNGGASNILGMIAVAPVAADSLRGADGNGGEQQQAGNLEEWSNTALAVEVIERRPRARSASWAARRATDLGARREARNAERGRFTMPEREAGADRQLKKCPRCTVDIEKIGGCNRMTCRCGHHFCWHCLEDYSAYGSHFCGRPDANRGIRGRRTQQLHTVSVNLDFLRQTLYELATDASFNAIEEDVQKRVILQEQLEELERFAHFYNRYHAHQEGQRYSERLCPCLEGRADDYVHVAGIFSGTDVDFIRQANETLVASRRMLKYAYCAAYFHYVNKDSSASEVGKDEKNASNYCGETHAHLGFLQLERLERFTEELSGVSENVFTRQDRSRVIDLISVVSKSMEAVADFEKFS